MSVLLNLVLTILTVYSGLTVAMNATSIGGWQITNFDIQPVPENRVLKTTITTDSKNIRIRFHLISQIPAVPAFTLDEETGVLMSTAPLDYETSNQYVLKIRAENAENGMNDYNERNVAINVYNINEKPEFDVQRIWKKFLKNQPAGTKLVKVNATDPEGDEITYALKLEKHFAKLFAIDEKTGWIIANKTLEVRDSKYNNDYRFLALAFDNGTDTDAQPASVRIDIQMGDSAAVTMPGYAVTLLLAFMLIELSL